MNVQLMRSVNKGERAICYCKIDVSLSCVCPVSDTKLHHNIVKAAVDPQPVLG